MTTAYDLADEAWEAWYAEYGDMLLPNRVKDVENAFKDGFVEGIYQSL